MNYPLGFAAMTGTTSRDLVAAVTSADTSQRKSIRVTSYNFVPSGIVAITFQSGGSTAISGAMVGTTSVPISDRNPNGVFQTAPGEKLNVVLSGSTGVNGHLTYELV